jgi:hypothetical protein
MTVVLRPGLSFCRVEGRTLFLDRPADRYFCLAGHIEHAFVRTCQSVPAEGDLEMLLGSGIVRHGPACSRILACPQPPATTSFADEPSGTTGTLPVLIALSCLLAARARLRVQGFEANLRQIERTKARLAPDAHTAGDHAVRRTARAFARCAHVMAVHDRCLPTSLALARCLIRLGLRPDLVIGVRLHPFQAHAWVQWHDTVVNERIDVVRTFTPIFVA